MAGAELPQNGLSGAQLPRQHRDLEHALPLAPVHGQNLVALQLFQGLLKVVVDAVNRVLLGAGGGLDRAGALHFFPQALADGRVVGKVLGNDVFGALQGRVQVRHAFFPVHKPGGQSLQRGGAQAFAVRAHAGEDVLGQGLQAPLPGYAGPCFALGAEGPVQVLHLGQGGGGVDGGCQLGGQLFLLANGGLHLGPALVQAPQVLQALRQRPDGLVVHGSMLLLAVAGDEGDGVALVQQLHHSLGVVGPDLELGG